MKQKNLAYYLTYQFIPKTSSKYQFPKSYNPRNTFKQSETWITAKLHDLLDNIIKTSLGGSTQPVGLLLSGGVDSAILLYLLRKNTNNKIYTISGAYSTDTSHFKQCASLAREFNTIHQELIIFPQDMLKLSQLYLSGPPNPIGDNGLLPTYLMMKKLSHLTKTIYSGDGTDCLFQGLEAHRLHHWEHASAQQGPTDKHVLEKIARQKAQYPDYEHYKYDEIFLSRQELRDHLDMDIDLAKPLKKIIKTIKAKDLIKRTILLDLNFLVANRVDYLIQAAAINNVKVLLPYLDPRLIDYALRIPKEYFFKGAQQKYILRKAFKNALPKNVFIQPKKGMTPPFLSWYLDHQSFLLKTLGHAQQLGISKNYIHYLVRNIKRSNEYAYGMRIWLILNLVLWHEAQRVTPDKEL